MADAVRFEVQGLRDLLGRFARDADEGLHQRQDEMLRLIAARAKDRLEAAAPRGPGPGPHLADLFAVSAVQRSGSSATIAVTNAKMVTSLAGQTYSLVQLITTGTRPHVITGNPILHFTVAGEDVFVRQVSHPGTAPNDFVSRSVRELDPQAALMTTARGVTVDLAGSGA